MTPALVSIIIIVYFAVSIGMSIIPSNGADRDIFLPQTGRHPDAIKPARFFPISRTTGSTGKRYLAAFQQPKGNQPSLFRMHSH
jgi:hypothetical protein